MPHGNLCCSTSLIYKQLKPGSFMSWNYSMAHASLIQKRQLQPLYLQGSNTILSPEPYCSTVLFCSTLFCHICLWVYLSVTFIWSNSLWTARIILPFLSSIYKMSVEVDPVGGMPEGQGTLHHYFSSFDLSCQEEGCLLKEMKRWELMEQCL